MESTDLKQSSPDATAPETQASPKPVKVRIPKKKKKWIKRVIVLVVLIAVVVFLLRSCSGGSTALTSGTYLPDTASTQDLVVSVSGTGAIEPLHSYKVTTLVKGEVLEAPFEGDRRYIRATCSSASTPPTWRPPSSRPGYLWRPPGSTISSC